jgi:hypothetical protein
MAEVSLQGIGHLLSVPKSSNGCYLSARTLCYLSAWTVPSEFLTGEERDRIAQDFAREIRAFNYVF